MKMILDFSLSDSRAGLNTVLVDMQRDIAFEIHQAIASYETALQKDTGKPHLVVDAPSLTSEVVGQLTEKLKLILGHPLPVSIAHWDDGDDILELIREGFESGNHILDNLTTCPVDEFYVTLPIGEGEEYHNMFQLVNLSELLTDAAALNIENIIKHAEGKVIQLCRNEIALFHERMGKTR